ncbi:aldehyde dehydrogenase family protein [Streptomyces sp. NRRL B-24572]|uniref:aldehyde dehydrogenase family protein n=1 Tax=Streptomyces sp. NRRL B-24572 TaxID=1962156 RepID=UPI00117FF013
MRSGVPRNRAVSMPTARPTPPGRHCRAWRAPGPIERAAYLAEAGRPLTARADEFAAAITREQGKLLPETRGEVVRARAVLDSTWGRHGCWAEWQSRRRTRGPWRTPSALTPLTAALLGEQCRRAQQSGVVHHDLGASGEHALQEGHAAVRDRSLVVGVLTAVDAHHDDGTAGPRVAAPVHCQRFGHARIHP